MNRYSLHNIHALTVSLLAISGWLLYSSELRLTLAAFRSYLRDAHILLGFIFIAGLIAATGQLVRSKRAVRAGHWLPALLCLGAALTGSLLVLRLDFGGMAVLSVINLHRLIALAGTMALAVHVCLVWAAGRQQAAADDVHGDKSAQGAIADRRQFVRWLAALGAMAGIGMFANHLRLNTGQKPGGLPGKYADCNKMEPPPTPSLGSVPPIGGGYKGEFEVFTVTPIPCSDSENWRFAISGLVDKPAVLNWEQFLKLPRKVQVSNFHCITGWSVYNVTYEGIALPSLLDMIGVKPDGKFVKFISGDGVYTSALSLEQARMSDVMIAVLMDGMPIPSSLGGPARLLVPQMYAYKGVKWLTGVEVIAGPHIGFWESRGYENDAWVRGLK